jgi:DNA-binding transcriptional ArsR family regulator
LASPVAKKSESTANLIAAVSHPIRQRAMTILAARVASPSEIAQEINLESNLDLSPGHVSYHVRALEKAGLVEMVKTTQVRGATEHFYRGTQRAMLYTPEWEKLSQKERQQWSERAWSIVIHDAARALDAGTFDRRPDRFFTHTPLNLDEQGWRALSELQDEMLQRAFDIQAESDERRQETEEPAIRTIAVMIAFEAAPSKG